MASRTGSSVKSAFSTAWKLRWPFLGSHLLFVALTAAILTPLLAGLIQASLRFSGAPALADQDIARFLLSPLGLVCLVIVASVFITGRVLDTACMMAIAGEHRARGSQKFSDGLEIVMPELGSIFGFAVRLTIRVLGIALPFAALAAVIAWQTMTEFDINYYLSAKPPSFLIGATLIGLLLAVLGGLLINRLSAWALALPLVLFDGAPPSESFARSEARMFGHKLEIGKQVALWALISGLLGVVLFALVGFLASGGTALAGSNLSAIAGVLLVFSAVWAGLNTLLTTLTTGAFAAILMERAGWPVPDRSTQAGRSGRLVLGAVVIAGISVIATGFGGAALQTVRTQDTVEIIAHRGAAGARPENTTASVEKALIDATDWVEIDVQETADGEVVVIHDSDFMKIAGVDLKIWDATMEDLSRIDIGSWFDTDYANERTPTLRSVLEQARGRGKVLIELKYYGHDERLEERVAEIVEDTGMVADVALMSLKYPAVQKMKSLRPDWRVGLLAATALGDLTKLDADFLAVNGGIASAGFISRARDAGRDVYVWTVNDPLDMSRMISLGANGLITDEPALARSVLEQRAALSSVERLILFGGTALGLSLNDRSYRDASP